MATVLDRGPGHAGAVRRQHLHRGTAVNSGTVQVSQDANLGAASGALSLDGGTLAATASFDTGRAITVGLGDGGINVAAGPTWA